MTKRERAYAKLEELKQLALSGAAQEEEYSRILRQAMQAYMVVLADAINPCYQVELPYILAVLKIMTSEFEKTAGKEAADLADRLTKIYSVKTFFSPSDSPFTAAVKAEMEADL